MYQTLIFLSQIGHQIGGGAQAEDRVIVVDQRDLTIAHIDVARDLDERRLGGGHDAERIADRVPVAGHPEEQVGRAWLIALEDRFGQQVELFVFPNLVSIQQHPAILPYRGKPSIAERRHLWGC